MKHKIILLIIGIALSFLVVAQGGNSVIFRIQLGMSSKMPDESSIFRKHFSDIEGIELEDGKIRVFTGKYETFHKAESQLEAVKSKGYKYATIVAFHKGKRISTDKAMEIIYGD